MRTLRAAPIALLAALASASPVLAQSSMGWTYGYVPTPAEWNNAFAKKQDYLGALPLLTTGGTMTGELITAAATTGASGFNITPGVAPTSPVNGDVWVTTAGLYVQINGATVGPIGTASAFGTLTVGGGSIGSNSLEVTGTSTFNGSVTFTSSSLIISGNLSVVAWTTNGVRIKGVPGTLTDTTSSGTVAAAYTDVLGGNTIAASSAAIYTNYFSQYVRAPVAGTNVTLTNAWAIGGDSLRVGTSNSFTVTAAGVGTFNGSLTIGTPLNLASGGTNASLTASAAASSTRPASALAVLPGTVTANLCLLSGSSAAPIVGGVLGRRDGHERLELGRDAHDLADDGRGRRIDRARAREYVDGSPGVQHGDRRRRLDRRQRARGDGHDATQRRRDDWFRRLDDQRRRHDDRSRNDERRAD